MGLAQVGRPADMATLQTVLSRGYLPKELPTAFTSQDYGTALAYVAPAEFVSGGLARKSCSHTLARAGMVTRTLTIPDPVHFYRLASLIVGDWSRIAARFTPSRYSLTLPVDDSTRARAWVPAAEPTRRTGTRAEHAAYARYRVLADVSQWYPSTYTHTLDWAIRGKAEAKAKPSTSGLGPLLDIQTRRGQDRQSIGIPIGPDTSLVLGELLLAQVDLQFDGAMGRNAHGFRYYDDYEVFTATRQAADQAVTELTKALAEWQLILNPYKLDVQELPIPVEDEWVSVLKRIRLGEHPSRQRSDLSALLDEAGRLAKRFPREQVFSYALGQVISRTHEIRHRFARTNWPHLQNLVLQAALSEPGLLGRIGILLIWARDKGWRLDRRRVENALNLLVVENASRGNASEVAWGVWLAIQLGVPMRAAASQSASRLSDDVVALVSLHARDLGIIKALDVSGWALAMTREGLLGEHWLLAYEAYIRGWLPSLDRSDYVGSDPAFDFLRSKDVHFYDTAAVLPMARLSLKKKPAPDVAHYLGGVMIPEPEEPEPSFYLG
jgi:hypothetical protein